MGHCIPAGSICTRLAIYLLLVSQLASLTQGCLSVGLICLVNYIRDSIVVRFIRGYITLIQE